jgi:hypothetical protein
MMIENTLILVGPGGVGKGPLAELIRDDAIALDPYRLRKDGPRKDSDDPLYAPPRLRADLRAILEGLGDCVQQTSCGSEQMEWFPKARVLFFTVRGEWQCLVLHGLQGAVAKAELYAPILPALLNLPGIGDAMGNTRVLVLNPSPHSLLNMADWADLETRTRQNVQLRGDSQGSVQKRVRTIRTEAPAWSNVLGTPAGREVKGWPFVEHRFKKEDKRQLLCEARKMILDEHPDLAIFFKKDDEI